MTVFIAGAISKGFKGSHARKTLVTRLSLRPLAICTPTRLVLRI
jgi:hypothetical protein